MILQSEDAPTNLWQEETTLQTPNTGDSSQPAIGGDGDGEEDGEDMEEDAAAIQLEGEDKDLLEDDLRQYHKVDSVNSIASLRMKPDHLFRL